MSAETAKVVHWTQTPEGRKRMSDLAKKQHKKGKGVGSPAAKEKAVRSRKTVQSFPLHIIPEKAATKSRKVPKPLTKNNRVELALALVTAVKNILEQ